MAQQFDGGSPLGDHWTAEYENIVEFYFWEPQHLNRVSPPRERRRPLAEVLAALMKREVPLNHQLNIFFRLAPRSLIRAWLAGRLPTLDLTAPSLTDPLAYRRSAAFGACQADLWFEDAAARAFVELKVDAKSSLQQLCKYALLNAVLSKTHGAKPAGLILMGRSGSHFADMAAHVASRQHTDFEVPLSVLKHATRVGVPVDEVRSHVSAIEVGYEDYQSFDRVLLQGSPVEEQLDAGAETLQRLIGGMRAFLRATVLDGVPSAASPP